MFSVGILCVLSVGLLHAFSVGLLCALSVGLLCAFSVWDFFVAQVGDLCLYFCLRGTSGVGKDALLILELGWVDELGPESPSF